MLVNQALSWHRQGHLRRAEPAYRQALSIQPEHGAALHLLGVLSSQTGRHLEAVELIRRAIAVMPGDAAMHAHLGIAFNELGEYAEALRSYNRALSLDPCCVEAYVNRGITSYRQNNYEQALADYDMALLRKPDLAEIHVNRGNALFALRRYADADSSYDRAISVSPDSAHAHVCKAYGLLALGRYDEGWRLHEWRWKWEGFRSPRRNFRQPLWLGQEPLCGKTILLHGEQGLGDAIQFSRYVPLVVGLGAAVLLEVDASLVRLFRHFAGPVTVVEKGAGLPDFDAHCPLMSLPLAFRTSLGTVPFPDGYLACDPAGSQDILSSLPADGRLRIGLAWSGNPKQMNARNSRVPLSCLMRNLPGEFGYVGLQKQVLEADAEALRAWPALWHAGDRLRDFADTAALCASLDLVVSCDTSVAHLNASMGRPTWVMLCHDADWRWLLDGRDSPWYSHVRLYRQARNESWDAVLRRISLDLAAFAGGRAR